MTDDDYLEFLYSTLTGCVHELILTQFSGGTDSFRDLHMNLYETVVAHLTPDNTERAKQMVHNFVTNLNGRGSILPVITPCVDE